MNRHAVYISSGSHKHKSIANTDHARSEALVFRIEICSALKIASAHSKTDPRKEQLTTTLNTNTIQSVTGKITRLRMSTIYRDTSKGVIHQIARFYCFSFKQFK
jgi:bifunctional DNase/RNase